MAAPTNTGLTYSDKDISIREDLDDVLYKISPTETPFVQMAGRGKAENTLHEWLVVELAAASDTNAVVEGDDVSADAANNGVRFSNYCQLSDKVASISSTNEAVTSAGNLTKMATQIALKVQELKRDMEKNLLSNKVGYAGVSTTARTMASFGQYLNTNSSRGTNGTDSTLSGTTAGYPSVVSTDGDQRALTEDLLKDAIQLAWTEGGTPTRIIVGAFNKRKISGFAGNATRMKDADDKRLVAAIDVYVSDFGELQVIADRFSRTRDLYIIDPEYVSVDYLQTMKQSPLAKTGHADKRMVSVEYTLKVANEKAHAAVFDLTTS